MPFLTENKFNTQEQNRMSLNQITLQPDPIASVDTLNLTCDSQLLTQIKEMLISRKRFIIHECIGIGALNYRYFT